MARRRSSGKGLGVDTAVYLYLWVIVRCWLTSSGYDCRPPRCHPRPLPEGEEIDLSCSLSLRERAGVRADSCESNERSSHQRRPLRCHPHPIPLPEGEG